MFSSFITICNTSQCLLAAACTLVVLALFGADVEMTDGYYSSLVPYPADQPPDGAYSWGFYLSIAQLVLVVIAGILFIIDVVAISRLRKQRKALVVHGKTTKTITTVEHRDNAVITRNRPPSSEWKPIFPQLPKNDVMYIPPQSSSVY